jgi:soluble lytic murein transglycosylase-like protein
MKPSLLVAVAEPLTPETGSLSRVVLLLGVCCLAACTSTSGVEPTLSLAGDGDIVLPDAVGVVPESAFASPAERRQFAKTSLAAETETAAEFRPSGYAVIDPPAAALGPVSGVAPRSSELDELIERYAGHYQVPVELVRRVVKRESNFRPAARNGPYWGLMQIRHDTARGMGYRGAAGGLLDAETNLRYAVKYLRGAWITAGGNHDLAVRLYARGYYYDAKRKGLLEETGLKGSRRRRG